MENQKGASREEKLKKVFTGITLAGGVGVLAFLLIYAPDDKESARFQPVQSEQRPKSQKEGPPDIKHLEGVEFFPDEGQEHVPDGTRVIYRTDPPTSGRHYDKWLPPGVHEREKVSLELAVHNLEHGNIVIYFDPDHVTPDARDSLLDLPKRYAGQWDGVVLISQKGMAVPLILTAWRAKMPLSGYDAKKIEAFLDAFRGRGPEHPVR